MNRSMKFHIGKKWLYVPLVVMAIFYLIPMYVMGSRPTRGASRHHRARIRDERLRLRQRPGGVDGLVPRPRPRHHAPHPAHGARRVLLIKDPANEPANLPAGPYDQEIAIQDRLFDTNGQLIFPAAGINPTIHPYWVPEFFRDTIVVNGKTWPLFNVEPRRYRLRLLNGSNARLYNLSFNNTKVAMWQIATEGGYLDAPPTKPPGRIKIFHKIDSPMADAYQLRPGNESRFHHAVACNRANAERVPGHHWQRRHHHPFAYHPILG